MWTCTWQQQAVRDDTLHLLDLEVNGLSQYEGLMLWDAVHPPRAYPAELCRDVHVIIPLADVRDGPDTGARGVLGGLALVAAGVTRRGVG